MKSEVRCHAHVAPPLPLSPAIPSSEKNIVGVMNNKLRRHDLALSARLLRPFACRNHQLGNLCKEVACLEAAPGVVELGPGGEEEEAGRDAGRQAS